MQLYLCQFTLPKVPAAFPHQVLFFRKSEKLKLSEKNEYFHSGISKNWTHDLPIDKGAFEGGNLEGKRADEHILLSVWSRKSGYFPRYCSIFPQMRGRISVFSSYAP